MGLEHSPPVDSSGLIPPEKGSGKSWRRILKVIGTILAGIAGVMAPSSQGHQCGGCPMCMPPRVTIPSEEQKKEEDEDEKDV